MQSIYCMLLGYFTVSFAQLMVLVLFNILNISYNVDIVTPEVLFWMILSAVITFALYHLIPFKKIMSYIDRNSNTMALFFVCCILLFSFVQLLPDMDNHQLGIFLPTLTMFVLFGILAVFILMDAFANMKKEQALHDYDTYIPILNEMIENIRCNQHLYNNQILSLTQLPELYDNYEDICEAIHQLSDTTAPELKESYQFLHLQNHLLAALLYSKYIEAAKQNKKIVMRVNTFVFDSRCSDFQLVDITGILIDNALEASSEKDTIYLTIGGSLTGDQSASYAKGEGKNNKYHLRVENPGPQVTTDLIRTIFRKHYSTKKDAQGHGLGLPILKSILNKNKGQVFVYNTTPEEEKEKIYICFEVEV